MRILIGADFVPTTSNVKFFEEKNIDYLFGQELYDLMRKADFRIFNLEIPFANVETPIHKCGPNLIASTKTVELYRAFGVDLLTLANNHILDQGQQGLDSTLATLDKAGIQYTGVGANPTDAAKPFVFSYQNQKIGVYACSEQEFSIVTDHSAGANPIDLLDSPDHVAALKRECDYVIVLYHGGKEHYRYPSPNLQKVCHKLVEKGADLVICQHSHCIGCEEKYLHGTIVYGQGNFLFDRSQIDEWQTGLVVQIDNGEVSYIPIRKHENAVRIANAEDRDSILSDFYKRSSEILQQGFIESQYQKFSKEKLDSYLWKIGGSNQSHILRIINRISGNRLISYYMSKKYNRRQCLRLLNYIECEAHREALIVALKSKQNS